MFSKIRSYGLNRVQDPHLRRDALRFFRERGQKAKEALKPAKISREEILAAYSGRYEDDGRDRFLTVAREQGLTKNDLAALVERHKRDFMFSLALAAGCAILAVIFFLAEGSGFRIFGGLIFGIFMFGFTIKAFGADYAAFQVQKRKFCSLRTYFREGFFRAS